MTRPPIVRVEWIDSTIVAGAWEDRQTLITRTAEYHGLPIITAGFLVDDAPGHLLVCLSLNEPRDDIAQCMAIPRAVVQSVVTLQDLP